MNADGKLDILSGCYDYMSDIDPDSEEMAGIFHVFWGEEDQKFEEAKTLEGIDDEPLTISTERDEEFDEENASEEEMMAFYNTMSNTFCTRPTAADLNGDGHLDLVVGNAAGTFFLFQGKGDGKFEPKSQQLMADGDSLTVSDKSDPCVVDWDNDGDLDIVSGAGQGGVYVSINDGDKKEAKFKQFEELVAPTDWHSNVSKFGDDHIKGPSGSTRVCVEDVNGDGALDLLVGDSVTLTYPADGLKESEVKEKLAAWQEKMNELEEEMRPLQEKLFEKFEALEKGEGEDYEALQEELEKELNASYEKMEPLYEERSEIVREEMTGFVWVYYRKPAKPAKAETAGQSLEEFKKYVAGKVDGLDDSTLDEIAAAVDKDADGTISDTEFEGRFEAIQEVMQ